MILTDVALTNFEEEDACMSRCADNLWVEGEHEHVACRQVAVDDTVGNQICHPFSNLLQDDEVVMQGDGVLPCLKVVRQRPSGRQFGEEDVVFPSIHCPTKPNVRRPSLWGPA